MLVEQFDSYHKGLIEIAIMYGRKFINYEMEPTVFVNCSSIMKLMLALYNYLVLNKSITPIELLEQDIKENLYQESKQYWPDGSIYQRLSFCKVSWTLLNIIQQYL